MNDQGLVFWRARSNLSIIALDQEAFRSTGAGFFVSERDDRDAIRERNLEGCFGDLAMRDHSKIVDFRSISGASWLSRATPMYGRDSDQKGAGQEDSKKRSHR